MSFPTTLSMPFVATIFSLHSIITIFNVFPTSVRISSVTLVMAQAIFLFRYVCFSVYIREKF